MSSLQYTLRAIYSLSFVLMLISLVLCLSHKCEPGSRWLIANDKLEIYYDVIQKQCTCDIQIR